MLSLNDAKPNEVEPIIIGAYGAIFLWNVDRTFSFLGGQSTASTSAILHGVCSQRAA